MNKLDTGIHEYKIYKLVRDAQLNTGLWDSFSNVQREIFKDFLTSLEDEIDEYVKEERKEGYDNGYEDKEEEFEEELRDIKYPDKANIETALKYLGITQPNLKDVMKLEWIIENWDKFK